MELPALLKAAVELGVIPALALFLVASMHHQNKRLLEDRRETERQLLKSLSDMARDNQQTVARLYEQLARGGRA